MLFNNEPITSALYFIYLKLGLGRNSDFDNLAMIKVTFDKTILQVW